MSNNVWEKKVSKKNNNIWSGTESRLSMHSKVPLMFKFIQHYWEHNDIEEKETVNVDITENEEIMSQETGQENIETDESADNQHENMELLPHPGRPPDQLSLHLLGTPGRDS